MSKNIFKILEFRKSVIDSGSSIESNSTQEDTPENNKKRYESTATRKDLQLGRRFFHAMSGIITATLYNLLLTHQQVVYLLGSLACTFYVLDQIRVNYPEFAKRFKVVNKYLIRAEEQLKESSGIPYAMAMLLTILTFPKMVALVAIYTLAIADPLSAIIGIRFGKRHIVEHKTVEGSAAFFFACFLSCLLILLSSVEGMTGRIWFVSFLVAGIVTAFEMVPIKLDDNLTIPLFTAFTMWIVCGLFGIHVYSNFLQYFLI